MTAFLLIITISLFAGQTLSMKFIRAENMAQRMMIYAAFSALAAGGMALAMGILPSLRGVCATTVAFGVAFGVMFALTIVFYNLAIATGPLSYTTFYFSSSMLLPAAAGVLLFGEALRMSLLCAIVLFLAAFFFLNTGGKPQSPQKGWALWCALTFLCNGLCAVLQKAHQTALHAESGGLMLVGFMTACLCYGIAAIGLVKHKKEKAVLHEVLQKNACPTAILALASLGGNLLLTSLAGRIPSAYLFPLVQGSIIVGVTLVSVFFFKEKLSTWGKIGIFLGVCAIVVINL
ncbi:MAG: hypothetical protein RSE27_01790 [Ruthenibacterium sp.]